MLLKKLTIRFSLLALFFFGFFSIPLLAPKKVDTLNLTSTRDTLETSRLSFHSSLEGGHSVGAAIITIDTSNHPSKSTANLHSGDSVYIGTSGDNPYTIADVISNNQFSITTGLNAADDDDTDPIYVKRYSTHTVQFVTASAIPNGTFRIRVPVSTTDAYRDDSNPDTDGFDMGVITTGDMTAPSNEGTAYVFGAVSIGIGGTSPCPANFWCFNFPYTGAGMAGVGFTGANKQFIIGDTNKIMNPSPDASHTIGTADSYNIIAENLDASNTVIDSTTMAVGVIESVRVTATVDPSITFTIAGVGSGGTPCGLGSLSVGTSAYEVPFGSLTLNTFSNASQTLTVSTNAVSGYVVTAQEDDQLGKDGSTTPNIIDTACGGTPCTETTARDWTSASSYPGFGYSLQEETSGAAAFEYNDSGTFYAKQFAAIADPDTAQTIMSGSTIASSELINVCYRVAVTSTQEAGDYENLVTYIATGKF